MKKHILFLVFYFLIISSFAQSIISISPNQGSAGTQLSAVMTCQNTFFQSGSPQGVRDINMSRNSCNVLRAVNLQVIDNEHLSFDFNIPGNAADGVFDLSVSSWSSPNLFLNSAFTVTGGTPVSLDSISPQNVNENQLVTLTLFGQNLQYIAGLNPNIYLSNSHYAFNALSRTVIDPNTLAVQFLLPAYIDSGGYNVNIYTTSAGCYRLTNALQVHVTSPKQLVSISPPQTTAGTTLAAVITSVNTYFMTASPQGINSLQLKDQNCHIINSSQITVINDTAISANFIIPPNAQNGFYDISLQTATFNTFLLPSALEITGGVTKELLAFNPATGLSNTLLNATITGTNLDSIFFGSSLSINIKSVVGYVTIPATNVISGSTSATMDFQIPAYSENSDYDFNVTSSKGCYKIPAAINLSGAPPRSLVSINPSVGYRGQQLSAIITGQNTYFMSGTPTNGVSGIIFKSVTNPAKSFTVSTSSIFVQDSNHLLTNFTVPTGMISGWYDVTVVNQVGYRWSLQPGFEVKGTLITGQVTFDIDSSGTYTAGDLPFPNKKVMLLPDSTISITDRLGNYLFSVDSGQYTVEMYTDTDWFVTTSPLQHLLNMDTTDLSNNNFGLQPYNEAYDLYLTITPGFPRCGNYMYSNILFSNYSTRDVSGMVYLVLDPAIQFISSNPTPNLISNDTIYWYYNNLPSFQSSTISYTSRLPFAPGDTITSFAGISANNSGNVLAEFSNASTQVIRCSFDPNDKSVEPLGVGAANYVLLDGYLEYMIRFQNTGNDTAYSVLILDTISDAMDMNSFSVVDESHPVQTHLYGHAVEFRFDPILLPDSIADEPGSHGYIKYRIKPKANSTVGTVVENHAGIYFDLNAPVITNTTSNVLTNDLTIGIQTIYSLKELIKVYPNPANARFNILLPEQMIKGYVRIVNSLGKEIKSVIAESNILSIDSHDWSEGLYYIMVTSADGKIRTTAKIVRVN